LKHGLSKGMIGLMGPQDGTAFFSNFSYRADPTLQFGAVPPTDTVPGVIRDWQISKPFKALKVDLEQTPQEQNLADLAWKNVFADANGLIDISRYFPRSGEPDCVFARTSISADREEVRKLDFGYSDIINIFLNGKIVFSGNSTYQYRDTSFLGIAGYFDSVNLPLRKGENELLLSVAETFGGWGFMCRDGKAVFCVNGMEKVWETPRELLIPESAAYDPARNCIYVSNYDAYNPSFNEGKQFITKITLDGRIETLHWVSGLKNTTGISVFRDKLYVAEPQSLVEIDIPTALLAKRHPVPGSVALNDIAVAPDGAVYISDSGKGAIFKFAAGQFEEWLKGPDVIRPNGVHVHEGKLIIGTNADSCLKSADLVTKEIKVIANLGPGIIDGIKTDSSGNTLVSQDHQDSRFIRGGHKHRRLRLCPGEKPGHISDVYR
jgi:sugar lactone lactonase YvrE